jgi:hypothetical protein
MCDEAKKNNVNTVCSAEHKYTNLRISLCDTSSDILYIILLSSSKAVLYVIALYTDKL